MVTSKTVSTDHNSFLFSSCPLITSVVDWRDVKGRPSPLSLWSIPPVSENHVRKRLVYEKTFLTHFPEDIFLFRPIRQNVWSPFIVIVHYFHIFRFPGCKFPIIPSYFPLILKFSPISNSPYFSYVLTLNFRPNWIFFIFPSPLNWQKHLFPIK